MRPSRSQLDGFPILQRCAQLDKPLSEPQISTGINFVWFLWFGDTILRVIHWYVPISSLCPSHAHSAWWCCSFSYSSSFDPILPKLIPSWVHQMSPLIDATCQLIPPELTPHWCLFAFEFQQHWFSWMVERFIKLLFFPTLSCGVFVFGAESAGPPPPPPPSAFL